MSPSNIHRTKPSRGQVQSFAANLYFVMASGGFTRKGQYTYGKGISVSATAKYLYNAFSKLPVVPFTEQPTINTNNTFVYHIGIAYQQYLLFCNNWMLSNISRYDVNSQKWDILCNYPSYWPAGPASYSRNHVFIEQKQNKLYMINTGPEAFSSGTIKLAILDLSTLKWPIKSIKDKYGFMVFGKGYTVHLRNSNLLIFRSNGGKIDRYAKLVGIDDKCPYFERPISFNMPPGPLPTKIYWNESLDKFVAFTSGETPNSNKETVTYLADYNDHDAFQWSSAERKFEIEQYGMEVNDQYISHFFGFQSLLFIFRWGRFECIDFRYGDYQKNCLMDYYVIVADIFVQWSKLKITLFILSISNMINISELI